MRPAVLPGHGTGLALSRRTMTTNRSMRGFTLIEMLVILTIMAVLAVVSLPKMMEAIESTKMRGITQGTVSLMRLARFQAIKSNACGRVQLDTAKRQISSYLDQDCDSSTANRLLGTLGLPTGVDATWDKGGDVVFQGTGSTDPALPAVNTLRFVNRRGTVKDVSVARSTGKISVL